MKALSLFSGIGGIDLAAEWAGIETVAFCERESFPQKVLKKHWPDIPIYDDVCTLTKERLEADGIDCSTIGIIHGGYPCQPFSHAGKREGTDDDRHLWPEVFRLIQAFQPRWFLGENVAGHVTLGLDIVLADLESISYSWETFVVPAAAVDSPNRRDRVFIVGYSERIRQCWESRRGAEPIFKDRYKQLEEGFMADSASWRQPRSGEPFESSNTTADREGEASQSFHVRIGEEWAAQSGLGGVIDGIPFRMDEHRWPAPYGAEQYDWEPPRVASGVKNRVGRLKSLGNAVNPHQIHPILAAIKQIDDLIRS